MLYTPAEFERDMARVADETKDEWDETMQAIELMSKALRANGYDKGLEYLRCNKDKSW